MQPRPTFSPAHLTVEPFEVRLRYEHAHHIARVALHKLQKHARLGERLIFRLLVEASDSDWLAVPLQDGG